MAQSLALARARISTPDGAVRYDSAQVNVRQGTMSVSGRGFRATEPGVTSIEQTSPSVWSVGFESGEVLVVERVARRCGSCGGRR